MLTFSGMESNIVLVRKTHIPHHVVQFFRYSWTSPMKMESGTDKDVTFYMVVKTNAEVTDNKNSNVTVGTGWTAVSLHNVYYVNMHDIHVALFV